VTSIYRDVVIGDGPISYWRLGDAGTTVVDEMGNHNGSYTGTPTHPAGALFDDTNTAMQAESGTKYASIPTSTDFDPLTGDFTLEYWLYLPAAFSVQSNWVLGVHCYANPTSTQGFWFGMDNDVASTTLIFQTRDGAGGGGFIRKTTALTKGAWQHVAVTYVKATKVGTLFVNGVQVASGAAGAPTAALTNPLDIFHLNTPTSNFPIVDEVAFYKGKILTAARLLQHYQVGVNPSGGTSFALSQKGAVSRETAFAIGGSLSYSGTSALSLSGAGSVGAATSVTLLGERIELVQSGTASMALQPSQAAAAVADHGSSSFTEVGAGVFEVGLFGDDAFRLTPSAGDPLIRYEGASGFRIYGEDGDTSVNPVRAGVAIVKMLGTGFAIVANHDPSTPLVPPPPPYVAPGSGAATPDTLSKYGATQVESDVYHSAFGG
jgi:hypothetical protein